MYTYEDAARAVHMIGRGLMILTVCLLTCVCELIMTAVAAVIRHPLQIIGFVAAAVAIIGFVPTLVAFMWLIA